MSALSVVAGLSGKAVVWSVEVRDAAGAIHDVAIDAGNGQGLALYPQSYPQAGRNPLEPAVAHRNNRTQPEPTGCLPRFRYAVPTHHNM